MICLPVFHLTCLASLKAHIVTSGQNYLVEWKLVINTHFATTMKVYSSLLHLIIMNMWAVWRGDNFDGEGEESLFLNVRHDKTLTLQLMWQIFAFCRLEILAAATFNARIGRFSRCAPYLSSAFDRGHPKPGVSWRTHRRFLRNGLALCVIPKLYFKVALKRMRVMAFLSLFFFGLAKLRLQASISPVLAHCGIISSCCCCC